MKAPNLIQYPNQKDKEEEGQGFLVEGTVIGDTYMLTLGMIRCNTTLLSCATADKAIWYVYMQGSFAIMHYTRRCHPGTICTQ